MDTSYLLRFCSINTLKSVALGESWNPVICVPLDFLEEPAGLGKFFLDQFEPETFMREKNDLPVAELFFDEAEEPPAMTEIEACDNVVQHEEFGSWC